MRLAWRIFVILWIEHVSCYDEKPYICSDGVKLPSHQICDGKRQCSQYYRYIDYYDEDYNVCVDTRIENNSVNLTMKIHENGTLDLEWNLMYESPTEEENRYFRDDVHVHHAGYFLTATSEQDTVKKTLPYYLGNYTIACLKPWTNYEILLRPFYTDDGGMKATYKIGEAAFKNITTPPAAPSAPTYVFLLLVKKGKVNMKIGHPHDWNGRPLGFRARWEVQYEDVLKRGYEDFDIVEGSSVEASTIMELDLVPGRYYKLYISARSQGIDGNVFVGPERQIEATTEPLDPVELTAQSIGPNEIDITWRTEGFADLFLVAVCNGSCPSFSHRIPGYPPPAYSSLWEHQNILLQETEDLNYTLVKVVGDSAESSVYSVLVERPALATNITVNVLSCYKNVCSEATTTTVFNRIRQPPRLVVSGVSPTDIQVTPLPSSHNFYELRVCTVDTVCHVIYTNTSATIPNLIPNSTYDVELREAIRDAKGHLTLGPAARRRVTTWSLVPLPPTVNAIVPNEAGDTLVLSWNFVNSTVDYLQISVENSEWKNCTSGAYCTMSIIHDPTPSLIEGFLKLSNLLLCTEYAISVRGCNQDGCGEGTTVSAWTSMGGPSAPIGLNVTSEADGVVNVTWTRPRKPAGPLGGYRVSWKCPGAEQLSSVTTNHLLTVRELPNGGTDCTFSVVGFNLGPWDHQFFGDSANVTFKPQIDDFS